MNAASDKLVPAIRLEGLRKGFQGFQLGPVDLVLNPGTVLALIGPNGAGKTTTLNCLAGLMHPDEGLAEVFGSTVDPRLTEYRKDIGYLGEESGFYRRWTARRNLEYMAKLVPGWSSKRADDLADRLALPLDKAVAALSRGNKTKLALIAALAHNPRLLLLDEPTSGLDPVVRSEVLDVLWEVTEDGEHAVLYSTHVLSDISRFADEMAFLTDGNLTLRIGRDELTENWRRISFRLQQEELDIVSAVEHRQVRAEHQVVTRDSERTLQQLKELAAESIEVSRMSVEEIAVFILKEGHHVERSAR